MTPIDSIPVSHRRYALISPCRNEAAYLRRTLDSVLAQSCPPALWIVVDDGSTDDTPRILAEYAARHPVIRVVGKPDRGHRAVGAGVVEAFYAGLAHVDMGQMDYICKLDMDLDLPPRYFETLMLRMEANPRLGSVSGKPYFRTATGEWVSERCGDEMSVGMAKFYRTTCFEDIGGFVSQVMWDGIDCHKAREKGWVVCSLDEPELRFEHLRPMGSSQQNILVGRARHGFGQYFMGSDPIYFTATAVYRMTRPPYVVGGLAMLWGYFKARLQRNPQLDDPALRDFIRRYQRRALLHGKAKVIAELEAEGQAAWGARFGGGR